MDVILDTLLDTGKTVPILYLVYLLIEFLERRVKAENLVHPTLEKVGPVFGAFLGCIPQCGFSAACTSLYHSGVIGAGTLAAVFISTSDEALPILLSHASDIGTILILLFIKVVIAITVGYLLKYTLFRNEVLVIGNVGGAACDGHSVGHTESHEEHGHSHGDKEYSCCHHHKSIFLTALGHTVKITLFILVTLLAINLLVHWMGIDRIGDLLLSGSVFQPALAAVIGLIPGCAVSVLLTELFLQGTLSFGSSVAGLVTGAGFGYLLLFQGRGNRKNGLKIIFSILAAGIVCGTVIQLLMG